MRLATLKLLRDVREAMLKVLEVMVEKDPNSEGKSAAARISWTPGRRLLRSTCSRSSVLKTAQRLSMLVES